MITARWAVYLQLPVLCLHVFVVYVIASQIVKKNTTLSTAFFRIYACQSVVDVANYLATVFIVGFDVFPHSLYYTYWSNFVYAVCGFCTSYQLLSHTLIAVNRYTAILHPLGHLKIWTTRNVQYFLFGIAYVAVISAILKIVGPIAIDEASGVALSNEVPWMNKANRMISLWLTVLTSLTSVALETRTFIAFRRLPPTLRYKYNEDFRLLLYALIELVVQMVLMVYYLTLFMELNYQPWISIRGLYSYVIQVLALSGSPILLTMSRNLLQQCRKQVIALMRMFAPRKKPKQRTVRLSSSNIELKG